MVSYTVKEILPDDYSATYSGNINDGFVVTNKYTEGSSDPGVIPEPDYPKEPENTTVKVTKIWDDNSNASGKRPESIGVSIIAGNSIVRTVQITKDDNWEYTFTELPTDLSYTVMEESVEGYSAEYLGNSSEGFIITNKYTGETDPGTILPPTDPNPPSEIPEKEPDTSGSKPTIPQTGTNNLPLYIIMALGSVLVLAGLYDVFNAEDEK